jgi:hypothetical protein
MYKRSFTQLSWATGAGHAAQTATMFGVTGKCTRMDVVASSVTGNPTLNVTVTDTDNSGSCIAVTNLADGTHHVLLAESHKNSQDANFNPVAFRSNDLTLSVDPSADAGGSGETLTVDVTLYLEEK